MTEEDWTLVKVPNQLIGVGVGIPVIPIRTKLRSSIFDEGVVKLSAILEELELFLDVADLQELTVELYHQSAETIALFSIREAYDDGDIEKIIEISNKVFSITNNPFFAKLGDSYKAAITGDAVMLSGTGLFSNVIASSAHLFNQNKKKEALSVLWPFLVEISEERKLSEIMLKAFGVTEIPSTSKESLLAFIQALR